MIGIHIHPIGPVGGDPPGGGVRMKEEALVFQFAHGVANRGWRDAQTELPGNRLTARRLGGLDIRLHHGFEHPKLALAQLL